MNLFRAFLTALTFLALLSPCFADPTPVIHYAPAENLEYVDEALIGAPLTDCVGKTTTATTNQMAILAPCSQNVITANQKTAPALIAMDITDANAAVNAGLIPVSVQALGMQNVEVWTHGSMAVRLTAGVSGMFSGNLDLSKEPTGPLRARFMAWNSAPGDNSYTVELIGEETPFVNAGAKTPSPVPAGAADMALAWQDQFATLSATPCKPGTGVWPNCTAPTASDGFTYLENIGDGSDYGDCAFEHTDGKYNPYTMQSGFLRIRATYDPNYHDPYGHNRKWYCGLLRTAFADGSSNLPAISYGYFEFTVLVPNAAAAAGATGGTWPAVWQTTRKNTAATGSLELDEAELYGNGPAYYQSGAAAYGAATSTATGFVYAGNPDGDLTWDWHRFGLLVTPTTVTSYFDDKPMGSQPMPQYADKSAPLWGWMMNLAMGSGWPVNAPPANHYDMWIKEIRLYH